jgi:maltooligosyltrehalose trehalohydrolase
MTALLLLQPATPMLFQGQEFSASAPFLYFADFEPALNAAVRAGRGEFLSQFPSAAERLRHGLLADPGALETFERCKLDLREREVNAESVALHRDLLRIRHEEMGFGTPNHSGVDGAVLSASAFMLRFFTPDHRSDRVLVVNLGGDLERGSFAEPLLAPPPDSDWQLRWSSDNAAYGGPGIAEIFPDDWWHIPAESAVLLTPGPRRPRTPLVRVRASSPTLNREP